MSQPEWFDAPALHLAAAGGTQREFAGLPA